jgi:hypothetical protein
MAALARTDWLENWKSLKKKNSSSSGPLDRMKPDVFQIVLVWSHSQIFSVDPSMIKSKMTTTADYSTFGFPALSQVSENRLFS